MAWPKGKTRPKTPGAGMKKGQSTKRTMAVKDMILQALDKGGGVNYLVEQMTKSPGPFLALVGKIIPLQITGADGGPVKTDNVWRIVAVDPHATTPDTK